KMWWTGAEAAPFPRFPVFWGDRRKIQATASVPKKSCLTVGVHLSELCPILCPLHFPQSLAHPNCMVFRAGLLIQSVAGLVGANSTPNGTNRKKMECDKCFGHWTLPWGRAVGFWGETDIRAPLTRKKQQSVQHRCTQTHVGLLGREGRTRRRKESLL